MKLLVRIALVLGSALLFALPSSVFARVVKHAVSAQHHAAKHGVLTHRVHGRPSRTYAAPRSHVRRHAQAVRARYNRHEVIRPRVVVPREPEPEFDAAGNPLLKSNAFMVQDLDSGQVLLERNAQAVTPIASITKLMTAMVTLDARQSLSEQLVISDDDTDKLKGTGSRLVVGTVLTREEMINLALMSSENRAAACLARNYPGGMQAFLDAMNRKAHELGLADTVFHDATGLNPRNVSSARDLARMVTAAAHYPLIREFSTTDEKTFPVAGRVQTFRNTNGLVKSPDWQIGVSKTGYISEAGRCLVMQAWFGNRPVAIVLLDSVGRFSRIADAQRVKRWLDIALVPHG